MSKTTRQTTQTLQENLSTVDWDALSDLEPDPAQMEQEANLPSAPFSPPQEQRQTSQTGDLPWTEEELKRAGIPMDYWGMAAMYDDLQEAKKAFKK